MASRNNVFSGTRQRPCLARSLGIDSRVGSLEPGKDADLVLWTADPLTTIGAEAYCTIVDGKVVYQAE